MVLPPVSVRPRRSRLPFVGMNRSTRDCCCASITTFWASAEASTVSVSATSSWRFESRIVWPDRPAAKVIVFGPWSGVCHLYRVAQGCRECPESPRLLTVNTASSRRSSSGSNLSSHVPDCARRLREVKPRNVEPTRRDPLAARRERRLCLAMIDPDSVAVNQTLHSAGSAYRKTGRTIPNTGERGSAPTPLHSIPLCFVC